MRPVLVSAALAALLLPLPPPWPEDNRPAAASEGKGHASQGPARTRGPVRLTEEALRVHREALVVDGHNDLPWRFREKDDLSFRTIDLRRRQPDLHTDIPRLRAGGVG